MMGKHCQLCTLAQFDNYADLKRFDEQTKIKNMSRYLQLQQALISFYCDSS
jgi:hypothetical protein